SEGAAVAVNYRKRENEAAEVVAEIERAGGRAIAVRADVSVNDEVQAMIAEVNTRLGTIDVLVNNAGMASIVDIDAITEAQFDRMLAVNLKSAFLCTQSVLRGMRQRRWGRIINMSSLAAQRFTSPSNAARYPRRPGVTEMAHLHRTGSAGGHLRRLGRLRDRQSELRRA